MGINKELVFDLRAAQDKIMELEAQLALVTDEYEKTWNVLRTYNPIDIELEYIGFKSVPRD